MSSDYPPYTRAVKPLDFGGVVGVKSDTKQATWGIVRDFKKLQYHIMFSNLQIEIPFVNIGLIYQFNFSLAKAWRISNWKDIQAKLDSVMSIANIEDVVFCVKHVVAGVAYRYKIAGRQIDVWDDQLFYNYDYPKYNSVIAVYEPAMAVVAPWYAGERISANFTIEIWSASESLTNFDLTGNLIIGVNTLYIPSTLEETAGTQTGTGYSRNDLDFAIPAVVPIVFPAPTIGN